MTFELPETRTTLDDERAHYNRMLNETDIGLDRITEDVARSTDPRGCRHLKSPAVGLASVSPARPAP